MKLFEFQKLFLKPLKRETASYWGDSLLVAQYLYKKHEGNPIKNKDIKKLWHESGPPKLLDRLIFAPDYDRIQAYYKNMKYSLNRVQQEIDDKMNALGEMLPEELEAEDNIIREYNQQELKNLANISSSVIKAENENTQEGEIELFKKPKTKYKF